MIISTHAHTYTHRENTLFFQTYAHTWLILHKNMYSWKGIFQLNGYRWLIFFPPFLGGEKGRDQHVCPIYWFLSWMFDNQRGPYADWSVFIKSIKIRLHMHSVNSPKTLTEKDLTLSLSSTRSLSMSSGSKIPPSQYSTWWVRTRKLPSYKDRTQAAEMSSFIWTRSTNAWILFQHISPGLKRPINT